MKLKWVYIIAVTLILYSCNGQEKRVENDKLSDVINAPKEDIKVNKEYDKDGNLIRYDSTYTYFYSKIEKKPFIEDSIFNNFRNMFDTNYPFLYKPFFNDLFFQDSLMKYDFYKEDFFTERFRRNREYSEKMFHEMDSLKNKFFMEQYHKKLTD